MNVTVTSAEGLRRELKVVIGADELERRLEARLDELKDRARIKGFRPGHVPKQHLRKVYGRSVMAEVVQEAVNETSREAISQREEQPAFQPKIALPEDEAEINKIFDGSSDLAYTMSFEVLPKFQLMDLKTLKLERPVSDVADDDITKSLERLAAANLRYTTKDGAAASGDRVTIDFVGKIDDEPFEGGTAEGAQIVLGSSRFIPGFEEGLTGTKAGEERAIDATFPDDYPEARLADKKARFEVKVMEVASPETPAIDDEFAKAVGIESLEQLRAAVKNAAGAGPRRRIADEAETRLARCAEPRPRFRIASDTGRERVQRDLESVHPRSRASQAELRGRGHDRGKSPCRISRYCFAARETRSRAFGDRPAVRKLR